MADKALAAEQCRQESAKHAAAMAEKAFAVEQRRQESAECAAAMAEKALAAEQRRRKSDKRTAALAESALATERAAVSMDLVLPPTAVSPPPHRPTMYMDAALSTMGGSLRAKSLIVAPLSCPSTTVDGQLQTACSRSRPRRRVGRRHGPRAPNPQEHLLCSRRRRLRAPNQSTVNG